MELETLKDLYFQELKDLYSAETQLIKALPKMAKAATNKKLTDGFNTHLTQTKEHAARLERILKSHDEKHARAGMQRDGWVDQGRPGNDRGERRERST